MSTNEFVDLKSVTCELELQVAMAKKQTPEDAFYENLTLGLVKTLANVPRVCNVNCEKRQPCEKAQVINWEQRHCVYLPEDMKKFYLSTDGFILQWSYQYAPNDIRRVGYIHFPHLLQITLLRENVEPTVGGTNTTNSNEPANNQTQANGATSITSTANANTNTTTTSTTTTATNGVPKDIWGNAVPLLTTKTKIFELNNVNDVAKVCLIYDTTGSSNPKFYLLELATFRWQFLADTFSEYLRMAIAHLGLPLWELCFASCGLPSWTEQLFLLLAPHLLEEHEPRRGRIINPIAEHPYNIVDPNVFRAKPKSTTKMSTASKHK